MINYVQFILLADPKLAKIFPEPPSVSFTQARNLKQILCKNTLKELPFRGGDLEQNAPGCYKHNHGGRGRGCISRITNKWMRLGVPLVGYGDCSDVANEKL